MDIRQLIDKINHFENKQILNEEVGIQSGTGKNAGSKYRGNFDEQELSDVLKAFDEQVNEIGGNGQPDYDNIISALDNRDIESAMEEIVSAYSDQDGGEIRSNDYDNYLEDLESEFKFLVYSDPSQRVSSTRPLVIRSDDKRATFNPTQFDDNGQRDNRVSEGNDQTSIYKTLIKEFGYKLDEAEEFQFSPEQEKFLGKANRQDPYILARMPGPKPPFSYFKDPEDQAIAKQMNFGANNLNKIKNLAGAGTQGDASTFAAPAPAKMRGGEPAAAAAAAPGLGLKPPSSGGFAPLPPLDRSDDRRVGGQGLKLPPQTPVTSVAAAQAALGAEDNPEAAMGAGSGASPVAANKPAAAPEDNPEAAMGAGSGAAPVAANKPASAPAASTWKGQTNEFGGMEEKPAAPAVATPVAPQTPNTATALPPAAGAEATKIARFKELLGKAKAGSVTPPAATKESVGYFLNKLRFIESRQLNEALTPAEQKEIDGLYAELGQQGAENNPELTALINDYNSLPKSAPAAGAAAPAFNARKDSQQFQDKFAADSKAVADKLRKIADDGLTGPQDVAAVKQMMDQVKQIQADPNFVTMAPELQNTINDAVKKAEPVVAAAPAAAAPAAAAPAAAAPAAGGTPANAAAMANANYAYVTQGSDQALAHAAGYGVSDEEVAKWRAAGSLGKPKPAAAPTAPVIPAAADPNAPRDANGVNLTNMPAGNAAASTYKGSAGAQEIQKLNPAIKDVNKIYPGQKFKMPDGSTYTVKPGDTLDKIAKGAKPAEATKGFDRFTDKAPQAATPPTVRGPTQPAATPPAAPAAPFRKELDIDALKRLSGQPRAPASPGKAVSGGGQISNTPAAESRNASIMNPVGLAPTKESIRNQDDAILERIRSALRF